LSKKLLELTEALDTFYGCIPDMFWNSIIGFIGEAMSLPIINGPF